MTTSNNTPESFTTPVDKIRFEVHAHARGIWIEFKGRPSDLVAAGVAEPAMIEHGRRGVTLVDSHGDHYWRRVPKSNAGMKLSRVFSSIERALELPGIAGTDLEDHIRAGVADIFWLRANPGRLRVDDQEWRTRILGARADLEAHGFAKSFFADYHRGNFPEANECLDGYFQVLVEKPTSWPNTNPDAVRAAASAAASYKRGSRPVLRLVVDNTRKAAFS